MTTDATATPTLIPTDVQLVRVVRLDIGFVNMMWLFVKIAIAAAIGILPALIVLVLAFVFVIVPLIDRILLANFS
jgi:hypothetical protein